MFNRTRGTFTYQIRARKSKHKNPHNYNLIKFTSTQSAVFHAAVFWLVHSFRACADMVRSGRSAVFCDQPRVGRNDLHGQLQHVPIPADEVSSEVIEVIYRGHRGHLQRSSAARITIYRTVTYLRLKPDQPSCDLDNKQADVLLP